MSIINKMRYEFAPDLQSIMEDVSKAIFPKVRIDRVRCFRSYGSSSKMTIARCHTIGKLIQKAMNVPPFYALEFISERFDKLDKEEQLKIIIHEIMHIPMSFGGGFRHHDHVCERNIQQKYRLYKKHQLHQLNNFEENLQAGQNERKEKENFFRF
ncbi:hypothetical protein K0A97_01355 [Patescibacteria group bacterium]|nr:hypothetical protein [Patescibacteria group bacterium]